MTTLRRWTNARLLSLVTLGALSAAAMSAAALSAAMSPDELAAAISQAPAGAKDLFVYFGTYTGEKSKGIYVSRLNAATGALSAPQLAAELRNPSYLAVRPGGGFLYAVSEVNDVDGKPGGAVNAFAVAKDTGLLTPLNSQSSGGRGPAHITVDRTGAHALVANYGGGSVSILPIAPDGRLGPASAVVQHTGSSVNQARQKEPHAHSVNMDPANRLAYVADLGIDKVMIYRVGRGGTLTPNDPPSVAMQPGDGPRHFAFHPKGRLAYVINELKCTITTFTVDGKGGLTAVQTVSTLPEGQAVVQGYSTADVQVHPTGRFLYGSNRGHDSIVVFAIDQKTGRLTHVQHQPTGGSTPRAFGIDPTGTYFLAANQRSDSVHVFRIDAATGRLTDTGHSASLGSPVCVKFVPPGF